MIPTAAIQLYDVILFVHISSFLLAFGPTFGYAVLQTRAERADPRSIPSLMGSFRTIDLWIGTTGAIVLLATGVYLMVDRWNGDEFFIAWGFVAIIVLLGLAHGFFIPHERKLATLAQRDIEAAGAGEVELSDEYLAASRRTGQIGTLAGLIVLATIFVMAVKPFL